MSDPNTPVKKFSFGRPGGTPVAAPAPAIDVTPGETALGAAQAAAPQNLPATQPQSAPPAFYTGGDDGDAGDAGDVKLPRLNIVQKSSGSELLVFGFGSFVLKAAVKLATAINAPVIAGVPTIPSARVVVAGIRPKVWIEKTKFGGTEKARIARSLDEVYQLGGVDKWNFSKENPKSGSVKPWFMPSVTMLVLVQKPADAPEDNFPFEADGKLYAAALWSVKSTTYESVFGVISSEKAIGVLRKGYNARFIDVSTFTKVYGGGESANFKLGFGEETTDGVKALAANVTGN